MPADGGMNRRWCTRTRLYCTVQEKEESTVPQSSEEDPDLGFVAMDTVGGRRALVDTQEKSTNPEMHHPRLVSQSDNTHLFNRITRTQMQSVWCSSVDLVD